LNRDPSSFLGPPAARRLRLQKRIEELEAITLELFAATHPSFANGDPAPDECSSCAAPLDAGQKFANSGLCDECLRVLRLTGLAQF
jgi:hypothetical protein